MDEAVQEHRHHAAEPAVHLADSPARQERTVSSRVMMKPKVFFISD
jgi:hypothetical protein